MKFKFLDKITADAGFEAFGRTYKELFENASVALFSLMCDVKKVKPKIGKSVELKREALNELLFDYLDELIFLKDRDVMVFSKFDVDIRKDDECYLTARVYGEKINIQKHDLMVDVKAVTRHTFKIEKIKGLYRATVVVDI